MLTSIDDGWDRWLATGEGTPPGWDDDPWGFNLDQVPSIAADESPGLSGVPLMLLNAEGGGKSTMIVRALMELDRVHDQATAMIDKLGGELPEWRTTWAGSFRKACRILKNGDAPDIVVNTGESGRLLVFQVKYRPTSSEDAFRCFIRAAVRGGTRSKLDHLLSELLRDEELSLRELATGLSNATVLMAEVASEKSGPALLEVVEAAHRRTWVRVMDAVFMAAAKVLPYQTLFLISQSLRATASILAPATVEAAECPRFSELSAQFAQFSSTR